MCIIQGKDVLLPQEQCCLPRELRPLSRLQNLQKCKGRSAVSSPRPAEGATSLLKATDRAKLSRKSRIRTPIPSPDLHRRRIASVRAKLCRPRAPLRRKTLHLSLLDIAHSLWHPRAAVPAPRRTLRPQCRTARPSKQSAEAAPQSLPGANPTAEPPLRPRVVTQTPDRVASSRRTSHSDWRRRSRHTSRQSDRHSNPAQSSAHSQ